MYKYLELELIKFLNYIINFFLLNSAKDAKIKTLKNKQSAKIEKLPDQIIFSLFIQNEILAKSN